MWHSRICQNLSPSLLVQTTSERLMFINVSMLKSTPLNVVPSLSSTRTGWPTAAFRSETGSIAGGFLIWAALRWWMIVVVVVYGGCWISPPPPPGGLFKL